MCGCCCCSEQSGNARESVMTALFSAQLRPKQVSFGFWLGRSPLSRERGGGSGCCEHQTGSSQRYHSCGARARKWRGCTLGPLVHFSFPAPCCSCSKRFQGRPQHEFRIQIRNIKKRGSVQRARANRVREAESRTRNVLRNANAPLSLSLSSLTGHFISAGCRAVHETAAAVCARSAGTWHTAGCWCCKLPPARLGVFRSRETGPLSFLPRLHWSPRSRPTAGDNATLSHRRTIYKIAEINRQQRWLNENLRPADRPTAKVRSLTQ